MAELRINAKWMAAASGEPEVTATAALVDMYVDNICLTRTRQRLRFGLSAGDVACDFVVAFEP